MWRGEFEARYIEELSSKAGREKSFKNFIELIVEAL